MRKTIAKCRVRSVPSVVYDLRKLFYVVTPNRHADIDIGVWDSRASFLYNMGNYLRYKREIRRVHAETFI